MNLYFDRIAVVAAATAAPEPAAVSLLIFGALGSIVPLRKNGGALFAQVMNGEATDLERADHATRATVSALLPPLTSPT
jgi:hypothetical protein